MQIKNVHVVPRPLDVPKFTDALADALCYYPHAAGRLQRMDGSWSIALEDNEVPVQIEYRTSPDVGIQQSWVVQDDLAHFLNSSSSAEGDPVGGDAPLLRLKLTIAAGETAIGISWHHTLGDATTLLRFMHCLSQCYQGLQPTFPRPTFTKHDLPRPSQETTERYLPLMPHLARTYPAAILRGLCAEANEDIHPIRIRISVDKLSRLRDRMAASIKATNVKISIQDCLTAYIVSVLQRCSGVSIRMVTNAASYRRVQAPFIDGNVAGNAISIVPALLDGTEKTLVDRAIAIRRAIDRARQPEFIADWVAVASQRMFAAANSSESLFFAASSDCVSVNSNLSLDWCSAHFGQPGKARFYTSGINKHYLRVFRSNPVAESAVGLAESVDVCFGVHGSMKGCVLNIVNTDLASEEFADGVS